MKMRELIEGKGKGLKPHDKVDIEDITTSHEDMEAWVRLHLYGGTAKPSYFSIRVPDMPKDFAAIKKRVSRSWNIAKVSKQAKEWKWGDNAYMDYGGDPVS